MKRNLTKIAGLCMALAATTASAGTNIGYIYVGAKTDGGYNQAQDYARMYVQKHMSGVRTNYLENIPENAQVSQAMERMIRGGDKIIFATSYGYLSYALEVAKKHPDVKFMHCAGAKTSKNLGTYYADMFQAMYLSGMAAGKASKTGKIGFVGAHPIPTVLQDINAITLGAQSVNPNIKTYVVYTGSWNDPSKDVAAVNSLADQGVDVVGMHVDSPIPVIQAAKKRGIYVIGYHFDDHKFYPKGWLTGGAWNWGPMEVKVVKAVENGTWKSTPIYGDLRSGAVVMTKFGPAVTPSARSMIEAKQKEIMDGKFNVWTGPIYTQDGKELVPAGKVLPRPQVDAMNFLVKGVVGSKQ
ncbi:MAG: BMP family ABC transporter substrate-binding protein [Gammaproteobacteria bacterium]